MCVFYYNVCKKIIEKLFVFNDMCTRRKTLTSLLLLVCFCFVLIFILFCIIVIQYESMVGPSTQLYDSGVELTSDGLYGRHDYLKHATRGTLSLHSLYLLLWSNFASFSLSFLTQPEAEKNISGKLLSKTEPAREFCVGQMKKLWILLGTGLGLSEEEKLLLVNSCLNNLLEVCTLICLVELGPKKIW